MTTTNEKGNLTNHYLLEIFLRFLQKVMNLSFLLVRWPGNVYLFPMMCSEYSLSRSHYMFFLCLVKEICSRNNQVFWYPDFLVSLRVSWSPKHSSSRGIPLVSLLLRVMFHNKWCVFRQWGTRQDATFEWCIFRRYMIRRYITTRP